MTIGYGRVSTRDQNLNLQEDALKAAGCERIYMEKKSGTRLARPELIKMLEQIREGDIVVVWKLDRLARSTADLIHLMNVFQERKVEFRCVTQQIDTTTPLGKFYFTIMSGLAQLEVELTRERSEAGREAARLRGIKGGRKPGLSKTADIKANAAVTLYKDGNSTSLIMKQLGIGSKRTLYQWLRIKGVKVGAEKVVMA
ncbi:recombinase family protein [Larkinella sp. GY13]|uniref:recombinase family protein n=1 Tax=Larkinella sp. GY13 TaxID=3453720 RepID=UPI003EECA8E6